MGASRRSQGWVGRHEMLPCRHARARYWMVRAAWALGRHSPPHSVGSPCRTLACTFCRCRLGGMHPQSNLEGTAQTGECSSVGSVGDAFGGASISRCSVVLLVCIAVCRFGASRAATAQRDAPPFPCQQAGGMPYLPQAHAAGQQSRGQRRAGPRTHPAAGGALWCDEVAVTADCTGPRPAILAEAALEHAAPLAPPPDQRSTECLAALAHSRVTVAILAAILQALQAAAGPKAGRGV